MVDCIIPGTTTDIFHDVATDNPFEFGPTDGLSFESFDTNDIPNHD
jgi:hypothetical protein